MAEDKAEEGLPPGLAALAAQAGSRAPERPVESWNPPHCGAIDIRVAGDGTWFYRGSPIAREALVRLFASVLRREPDGEYVLVTPVEKLGIQVDDAPFLAVEMEVEGEGANQALTLRTNVGDLVTAGPDHPLRFDIEAGTGGLKPYVQIRGRLEALLARQLVFKLADIGAQVGHQTGVWSGGMFFAFPEPGA